MRIPIALAALVLLASVACADQWIDTDIEKLLENAPGLEEYPDASAVFLKIQKLIDVDADGAMSVRRNTLTRILTLMGRERYSDQSFIYNSDIEKVELTKGITIRKTGRIVEVEEDAINDITPAFLEGATMYSNVLQKVISFPVAGRGATMELQLDETQEPAKDGGFSGIEYFAAGDPILEKEVLLSVPSDASVTSEIVPGWVGFQGESRMDENHWVVRDVPAVVLEEHTLSTRELYPRVLYSSYESWAEASAFFAGEFYPHVETDGAVAEHAAGVVDGLESDEDKTRALFLDVAENVRYTPLDLGLGGYEPNDAGSVLTNLYGDTRDMAVLLVSLLRSQGIDARPALVRGYGGAFTESVPTLKQFNKVLVRVPEGDGYRFLDPRLDDVGYGHLHFGVGNTTLVVSEDGTGELFRIARWEPEHNYARKTLSIQLSPDGSAEMRVICQLGGYYDRKARRTLKDVTPSEEEKYFDGSADAVSSGATSLRYSHSDLKNLMEEVGIRQTVEAPDFAVLQGDIMILRIPEFPHAFATTGVYPRLSERELPLDLQSEVYSHFEVKVLLPNGFTVERMPEPLRIETEYADFELECSLGDDGHTLFWLQNITIKKTVVPPEDYEAFKRSYDTLASPKNALILLRRTVHTPTTLPQ